MNSFRTRRRLPFFILTAFIAALHAGPALPQAGGGGKAEKAIRLHPLPDGSSFARRPDGEASSPDPRALAVSARLREALVTLAGKTSPGTSAARLLPSQRQAFRALSEKAGPGLQIRMRRPAGTPLEIKGSCLALAAVDLAPGEDRDEKTARSFLRSHSALLLIDEPDRELTFTGGKADDFGKRHLRFSQTYRGLPVWPADILIQIDAAGNVERLSGAFVATPKEVSTEPGVTAPEAAVLALASVPRAGSATAGVPELLIYAPGDLPSRLAWRIEVSVSAASQWLVLVDAIDGAILTAFNQVKTANVAGSGVDLLGITRALSLWEEGGDFFLVNTVKAMFDAGSNPPSPATTRGAIIILDARNNPPNSDPQTIPPLFQVSSTDANTGHLADGVSAAFGLSETYDYYLDRHSRDSLDGEGGTILGSVRLGVDFLNAFWFNGQMFFGDAVPFAASLDVVAHELTHGVTEKTANLVYQNQSGALNEAFSDIFGESVEARTTSGANDWLMGTDLGRADLTRNVKDPSSQVCCFGRNYPSKFSEYISTSQDNGGVHINSVIVTHAYYLLAEGLGGAIGIGDAERIFFRALTTKLVSSSKFIDARLACIDSAEDIFGAGSPQALKTAEAFDQVEILDGSPSPTPDPIPEVSANDATIFVYTDPDSPEEFLGRREEPPDPAEGTQLSASPIAATRPTVSGDGSFAVFVDLNDDACLIATNGSGSEECLGFDNQIHSIAVAPSGDLFGFVLLNGGNPENVITIVDLGPSGETRSFELTAPTTQDGSVDTVLFADAMDFTAGGRFLVYDAFNRLTLNDGTELGLWSIYALDTGTGTILPLVPPTPGLDIVFPSLSQTSDNFITFDAVDAETDLSAVVAGNLLTGEIVQIASVDGLGVPGFTGDDSAIVYSQVDGPTRTGFSLLRQALASDGISPSGAPTPWLTDAVAGVIYRRGAFAAPSHNMAITKITVPKTITLTERKPTQTKKVTVQIQNRSPHIEVIEDLEMLRELVTLGVEAAEESVGGCESPIAILRTPKKFPITLKPKKKLSVIFDVTFDCANDALKSSKKDPGHEDFSYSARVDHAAFDGQPDTDAVDDTCPRTVEPPFVLVTSISTKGIKDKGCGMKKADRTFGDPILTDVVEK